MSAAILTQKIIQELLDYNQNTGIFTWRARDRKWFKTARDCNAWNTRYSGTVAGYEATLSGKKYIVIGVFKKLYLAHRLAWLYVNGSFPVNEIDHKDGCGTNNTWSNLRGVSHSENLKNQRLPSNNKSGFTGVSWDKGQKKWIAQIMVNKRHINLGRYADWFEAVCARKSANIKYDFFAGHGSERPL